MFYGVQLALEQYLPVSSSTPLSLFGLGPTTAMLPSAAFPTLNQEAKYA